MMAGYPKSWGTMTKALTRRLGWAALVGSSVVFTTTAVCAQDPAQDPPPEKPAQEKPAPGANPEAAVQPPAEEKTDSGPVQIFGQGFARVPKNTAEFYAAIDYEIESGNLPLAGRLIVMMMASNPSEAELAELARTAPLTKIISYRRFSKWDANPKINEQYKKALEDLIKKTSDAYTKVLKDPERIRKIIEYLEGDSREFAFGVNQLHEMGPLAIPPLVDVMLQLPDAKDRAAVVKAIRKLGPETTTPLVAGLSAPDDLLKIELISLLVDRKATQAIGELWLLAGTAANPGVRATALKAISSISNVPESRLPAPVDALTQLAEDHYKQKFQYPNPNRVEIWRFDEPSGKIVRGIAGAEYPTASQVEELLGMRYAFGALKVDKSNRGAQKVLLSLGIDKGMARVKDNDLSKPLGMTNPRLADFLDTADPTILMELLEQSLASRKTLEVLALVKAIGQQAEPRAAQPWFTRKPLLQRAMSYGERRVEWAAAQAYLRAAETAGATASNQVVEVLSRSILGWITGPTAAVSHSHIIVASDNADMAKRMLERIKDLGREGIHVVNGGDLLRRLNRASDVDMVILDPNLPGYGTASLVAQLRSDKHYGQLPLVILGLAKTLEVRDILLEYADNYRQLEVLNDELAIRDNRLASIKKDFDTEEAAIKKAESEIRGGPTKRAEMQESIQTRDKNARAKYAGESQRATEQFTFTARQVSRREALLARQKELLVAFEAREERRFRQIEAQWGNLPSTLVVHGADAAAPMMLQQTVSTWISQLKLPPLTDEERQIMAEMAVFQLSRMAEGSPPGYDIKPAAEALLAVLRSTNLADPVLGAAIRAVAQLPGTPAQQRLAEFIMDKKRSSQVRAIAADALVMSFRRHTVHLPEAKRNELVAAADQSTNDPILREKLGALIGVLKPSVSQTGERLLKIEPKPGR